MKKYISILIILLFVSFASCKKIEKLPDEPRVEFRSFSVFDSTDMLGNSVKAGKLTFYFEDGDGDLGLAAPEVSDADTTNLFLTLFRKTNGTFIQATSSDPLYPSAYRIPYMETPGQNKILRGTIDVTMIYFFYNDTDTLYYKYWVKDRMEHLSNTDSTCVIVLGENGTCSPD
jgi:hypothetical protein